LIDQTQPGWGSRAHFMAVAARAMRQILIDHARGKLAAKRGSDWDRVSLTGVGQDAAIPRLDLLAIDEALTRLAALSERQAQVVELKFFGGLTIDEIAGVLDVSTTAIEKNWRVARAWLSRELKGFQKS
jgi:RNA polymerase sigma factor (TIGR02999 family)